LIWEKSIADQPFTRKIGSELKLVHQKNLGFDWIDRRKT
jgi:hypothetical protein